MANPQGGILAAVKRNPATSIQTVFAAPPIIILFITELRDASAPLGVPAEFWLIVSGVLTTAILLERVWQSVRGTLGSPSWGVASIVGYTLGAAAVVLPFIGELTDATAILGVPAVFWAGVGNALVFATSLHRVWQAVEAGRPQLATIETSEVTYTIPTAEEIGAAVAGAIKR